MLRHAHRTLLVLWALAAPPACGPAGGEPAGRAAGPWIRAFRSPDPDNHGAPVQVSVDTSMARVLPDGSLLVWMETRHDRPRMEQGRPFDRELLRFHLRCGAPILYRTLSATLMHGDGPPVYQRVDDLDDLAGQPWKETRPATADQAAFSLACTLLRGRP